MALDTLVSGAYGGSYNSVSVGLTRNGFKLAQQIKQEVIDETDVYGGSTIDYVYRGGDCFLDFVSRAYKPGSVSPFWPFAGLGAMGVIGRLASAIAAATVLSATAATPAAASPASLTATLSVLAPNFNGDLLFDSRLREVPVKLQLLPYSSGGILWFALT